LETYSVAFSGDQFLVAFVKLR